MYDYTGYNMFDCVQCEAIENDAAIWNIKFEHFDDTRARVPLNILTDRKTKVSYFHVWSDLIWLLD